MCGIAGVVDRSGDDSHLRIERALKALHHRGPDAAGIRDFPGAPSVTLGAVRLRVRDLSPGADQPMSNPAGTACLVYNGELYNAEELRVDLERRGAHFATTSDTECIVHLYDALRGDVDALLPQLRGMFALGIWDIRRQRLVLARDRLGIKPLAWSTTKGGIAFASEARALVTAGLVPRALDRAALGEYLAWGSVPLPATMFEGVNRLRAGEVLTWEAGNVRVRTWWRPPVTPPLVATRGEARALVESAVEDAVARHLVADRTTGVFLSGGTDSRVVATFAARSGQLDAVTATFPENDRLDEGAVAADVADRLGLRHVAVPVLGDDLRNALESILGALDQPSADAANGWIVCRAARDAGLVVALSGVGGDELFAGYPSFHLVPRVRTAAGLLGIAPVALRRAIGRRVAARHPGGAAARALGSTSTTQGAYRAVRSLFADLELDEVGLPRPVALAPPAHAIDLDAITELELDRYLANQLLPDLDGVSMAHSLEVRVPLLDDAVVACALALPAELRRSGKDLLAEAAGITDRPAKRPFTMPFDQWMRGPLHAVLDDAMQSDTLPFAADIPRAFRMKVWSAFEQGRAHWSRPWSIAMVRLWGAANGFAP